MKFLVVSLLVLAAIYGVFRGGMAASAWLTLSNIVSDVVPPRLPRTADDRWSDDNAGTLREAIVREADKNGIAVDPSEVSIVRDEAEVSVSVSYPYPFVMFRGETLVTVPVNVSRSFVLPSAAR